MKDPLVDQKDQYATIDDWVIYLAEQSSTPNQRAVIYLPELFFGREAREQ
jgi:hypothetical protein